MVEMWILWRKVWKHLFKLSMILKMFIILCKSSYQRRTERRISGLVWAMNKKCPILWERGQSVEKWTNGSIKNQSPWQHFQCVSTIKGSRAQSSVSSACRRAAAENAALLTRAVASKGKHALKLQEADLKARLERMELDTEIAASAAKI